MIASIIDWGWCCPLGWGIVGIVATVVVLFFIKKRQNGNN